MAFATDNKVFPSNTHFCAVYGSIFRSGPTEVLSGTCLGDRINDRADLFCFERSR